MELLRSEFKKYFELDNVEFFDKLIQAFDKKAVTISRCQREFGTIKTANLSHGTLMTPFDPRFNGVIAQTRRGNAESVAALTFSGMKLTLTDVANRCGKYQVGIRPADKAAQFIFFLNDEHPWIEAIEFNLRRRSFVEEEGALLETTDGGKNEVKPSDIEFDIFTIYFLEPPGRREE